MIGDNLRIYECDFNLWFSILLLHSIVSLEYNLYLYVIFFSVLTQENDNSNNISIYLYVYTSSNVEIFYNKYEFNLIFLFQTIFDFFLV